MSFLSFISLVTWSILQKFDLPRSCYNLPWMKVYFVTKLFRFSYLRQYHTLNILPCENLSKWFDCVTWQNYILQVLFMIFIPMILWNNFYVRTFSLQCWTNIFTPTNILLLGSLWYWQLFEFALLRFWTDWVSFSFNLNLSEDAIWKNCPQIFIIHAVSIFSFFLFIFR